MSFNQAMSIPLELGLKSTGDGPRLTWAPVKELEALRVKSPQAGAGKNGGGLPLEVRAEIVPNDATRVVLTVRGVDVEYDAKKGELRIAGHAVGVPLTDGRLKLRLFVDRTAVELFAADGLVYVPVPVIPTTGDDSISFRGGPVEVRSLSLDSLRSIWKR